MTVTVRPPLYFFPNPRPPWWGTNPDAYEEAAYLPLATNGGVARIQVQGRFEPRKYPPQVPGRMVGPQRAFRFFPTEGIPKKWPWPEEAAPPNTLTLPQSVTTRAVTGNEPKPYKYPPTYTINPSRSAQVIVSIGNAYEYAEALPPRKLPPPIYVRSSQTATTIIIPTALAQLQPEFDPTGRAKTYPPESVIFPPVVLNIGGVVLPVPPIPPEYPSKVSIRWTEDAALPNVAAQPPLIGIAQAMDDFSPTGLPVKRWFADPPFPNVAAEPNPTIPPTVTYHYPSQPKRYYTEEAAYPNVSAMPLPATLRGSPLPQWKVKYPWPTDTAPQNFWALPVAALTPALYDYPSLPAKRWASDGYPITNWVQETPPLPLNPPPLMVFEWPKHITLTWDSYQSIPPPANMVIIPIYIPEIGYEIYIPPRRFTIATPVREFFITVPWRTFTVSRKTLQTFDVKDPTENWPLSFNMGPDLFSGETLVGPISVTVTLIQGADPNPSAILNGPAGFDQTQTIVVQPVTGGLAGCSYELIVTCPTTNPQKLLTLRGVLPVQI